jgi:hypothetical protein
MYFHKNVRLTQSNTEEQKQKIKKFSEWILNVGNKKIPEEIKTPAPLIFPCNKKWNKIQRMQKLIKHTFGDVMSFRSQQ